MRCACAKGTGPRMPISAGNACMVHGVHPMWGPYHVLRVWSVLSVLCAPIRSQCCGIVTPVGTSMIARVLLVRPSKRTRTRTRTHGRSKHAPPPGTLPSRAVLGACRHTHTHTHTHARARSHTHAYSRATPPTTAPMHARTCTLLQSQAASCVCVRVCTCLSCTHAVYIW